MSIKIVSDTSADLNLPKDITLYDEFGITTFPMHIIFGDKDYRELVDIKTSDFYNLLETEEHHPTTSQPTQFDILECYQKFGKEYDEIISFHISSKLSGSYNNALIAKRMYEKSNSNAAKVYVVDSLAASSLQGLMAIKAVELVKQGYEGKEVFEKVREWRDKDAEITFTVKDINWLYKGGRLSKAKYFIGNMLNMKPVMTLIEGAIEAVKTVSGADNSIKHLIKLAYAHFDNTEESNFTVHVIESRYRDVAEQVMNKALEENKNLTEGRIFEMGGTIASHTGPGTLGFILTRDIDFK